MSNKDFPQRRICAAPDDRRERDDVASAKKKRHVVKPHGISRVFPRFFTGPREHDSHTRLTRHLIEIGYVAAFDRRLERRIDRAKHDFVRKGEGRGEIR